MGSMPIKPYFFSTPHVLPVVDAGYLRCALTRPLIVLRFGFMTPVEPALWQQENSWELFPQQGD